MGEPNVSHSQTSERAPRGRGQNIALWVVQAILALQFVGAGLSKLAGSAPMVEMFDDIGAGQWFRYVVGTLEVAGAIGLMVPLLSGLAALGLSALMVGATFTNIVILEDQVWLPLVILVASLVVAAGRRPGPWCCVPCRRALRSDRSRRQRPLATTAGTTTVRSP